MSLPRDHLHAATMVGRVAAAREAVEPGLRHRARRRPVGPPGPVGHRRHPRGSHGGPLQAGGGDHRRDASAGASTATGPGASWPGTPGRPSATSRSADLMARWQSRAGVGGLAGGRAGALGGRGPRPQPPSPCAATTRTAAHRGRGARPSTARWPPARCSPAATWWWPWRRSCSATTPPSWPHGRPGAGRSRGHARWWPRRWPGSGPTPRPRSSPPSRPSPPPWSIEVARTDAPAVAERRRPAGHRRAGAGARAPPHRRPARRRAGHHHLGPGRRADRRRGRLRQDHRPGRGARGLRGRGLRGDRHLDLGPGGAGP